MSPTIGRDRKRSSQTELILALLCIAILLAVKLMYDQWWRGIIPDYGIVGLAINYVQFGAVPRGLLGSIIYLSNIKLIYAGSIMYAVSAVTLIILSFFMLRRMTVDGVEYFPFLIVLAVLLLYWTTVIGRADIVVAVILVAAALALVTRRILLASSFLAIGVLTHEVAAIYGSPLLAAILLDFQRYKIFSMKSLAASCAILLAGAIIYASIMALPHSSNKVIVTTITSENQWVRWDRIINSVAFYMDLGGARGIRTSLCQINGTHRLIQPFVALIMVALALFALSEGRWIRWTLPAIASVPSVLFLWMTAIDTSRWMALGVLNIWIVCAVQNWAHVQGDRRWPWAKVICATAVALALYPSGSLVHEPLHITYASPLIESVIEEAIGHPVYKTVDECDPTWRSVLSQG